MSRISHFLKQYYVVIVATVLFLIHQFSEPFFRFPYIDSYLDDLLFFPIIYGILVFFFRLYLGAQYRLPITMIVMGLVFTFISTEVLFPALSNEHVSDPWDGVAYAMGCVLFHFSSNRPAKH